MTGGIIATAFHRLAGRTILPLYFMNGKDAVIPKDTEITAYTKGEIKLDLAKILAKQGNQK